MCSDCTQAILSLKNAGNTGSSAGQIKLMIGCKKVEV